MKVILQDKPKFWIWLYLWGACGIIASIVGILAAFNHKWTIFVISECINCFVIWIEIHIALAATRIIRSKR